LPCFKRKIFWEKKLSLEAGQDGAMFCAYTLTYYLSFKAWPDDATFRGPRPPPNQ